jgi:hypothetical protein
MRKLCSAKYRDKLKQSQLKLRDQQISSSELCFFPCACMSVSEEPQTNSLYAALARTAARSAALYFSRPVRLFRPSKVSGWQSLRSIAARDGKSVSPSYILSLVKDQGVSVGFDLLLYTPQFPS